MILTVIIPRRGRYGSVCPRSGHWFCWYVGILLGYWRNQSVGYLDFTPLSSKANGIRNKKFDFGIPEWYYLHAWIKTIANYSPHPPGSKQSCRGNGDFNLMGIWRFLNYLIKYRTIYVDMNLHCFSNEGGLRNIKNLMETNWFRGYILANEKPFPKY